MATLNTADTRQAHSPIEAEVGATFGEWASDRSVYWNAERDAWIVTGYAELARILQESDAFWRDIPLRDGSAEFWGRHLLVLEGRDHRRLHTLHMQLTGETFAENMRERASTICRDVLAPLVEKGRGELAADYADLIVFLIGCDFVGYDIDAATRESLLLQMQIRGTWKEALHSGKGIPLASKVAQDGQASLKAMGEILLPIIRDRREHPRNDLISVLWQKGPTVFPDWNENDVLSTCWSSLDNETKPLLRGLLYTLCRDPDLQTKLRSDPSLVAGSSKRALRFLTPFRTIRRVVKKDIEIGGETMRLAIRYT